MVSRGIDRGRSYPAGNAVIMLGHCLHNAAFFIVNFRSLESSIEATSVAGKTYPVGLAGGYYQVPLEWLHVAVQMLGLVYVEFCGKFGHTTFAVAQTLLAVDFWGSRGKQLTVGSRSLEALDTTLPGPVFAPLFAGAAHEVAQDEHCGQIVE